MELHIILWTLLFIFNVNNVSVDYLNDKDSYKNIISLD